MQGDGDDRSRSLDLLNNNAQDFRIKQTCKYKGIVLGLGDCEHLKQC